MFLTSASKPQTIIMLNRLSCDSLQKHGSTSFSNSAGWVTHTLFTPMREMHPWVTGKDLQNIMIILLLFLQKKHVRGQSLKLEPLLLKLDCYVRRILSSCQ